MRCYQQPYPTQRQINPKLTSSALSHNPPHHPWGGRVTLLITLTNMGGTSTSAPSPSQTFSAVGIKKVLMSSLLLIYYLHKGRLEKEDGGSLHPSLTNLFWLQLIPRWKMYTRRKRFIRLFVRVIISAVFPVKGSELCTVCYECTVYDVYRFSLLVRKLN